MSHSNQSISNNKKKYSNSLFIENDEFDCFVGDFSDNQNQKPASNPNLPTQHQKPQKNPLPQLSETEETDKEIDQLEDPSFNQQYMASHESLPPHPNETIQEQHPDLIQNSGQGGNMGYMQNFASMYNQVYQQPAMFPPQMVMPANNIPFMGMMGNQSNMQDTMGQANNDMNYGHMNNSVKENSTGGNVNNNANYEMKLYSFMEKDIDYVVERIENFIIDQDNCKMVQTRLEKEPNIEEFVAKIFNKIIPRFNFFTKDQFANYFCQKLVDKANPQQLEQVVDCLLDDVVEISKSAHGTRVLQKLIEKVEDSILIDKILNLIKGNVVE